MPVITACTMDCPDACSLLVERGRNGTPRIRGNPAHPFTRGFACAKIRRHPGRLSHPARLLKPMLRARNGWEAVSWDRALDLCAEKIQALLSEPESILHIPGAGTNGVLKEGVGLFFALLGSSRVRGSLCDGTGHAAYVEDFGSRQNPAPEDLLQARRVVNWGRDLSRGSVHLAATVRRARKGGTRVLTVSPGGDGNESFSDMHVPIRPGTDRFLAAAVIAELLDRGHAGDRVRHSARGWTRFEDMIRSRSPEDLRSLCGAAPEDVREIRRWYAGPGPCATIVGTGLQRYAFGGENVRFINALAFASGNMGRSGGGSWYHLKSFANLNLTWARPSGVSRRRSLLLPLIGEEILRANDPPVKFIWINGTNIVNQAPDTGKTIRALKAVPFKVVVDAFMTDTADQADLVLPSALMLEQEDMVGSYWHSNVQWAAAVVSPPEGARDDYNIVSALGKRLSPPVLLPPPQEIFSRSLDSPYIETTLEALKRKGWAAAKRPRIPYEGLVFHHAGGLYHPPETLHHEPDPPQGHPLRLLTLIRGDAIHSQIPPEEQASPPTVWAAPEAILTHLGGKPGEALLSSPAGRMRVRVRELEGLHPGAVLYRRGDWRKLGGGANRLIQGGLTDMGEGAPFYRQYVRLDPV
jgi:anaerobic selenocysteine-containing dehydrogenase